MGVPVLGLLGNRHASRVTASILTRLGLDSLVGKDENKFVEIAVHLAGQPVLLEILRNGLRQRMHKSSLCNHFNFLIEMESSFREMCNKISSESQAAEKESE